MMMGFIDTMRAEGHAVESICRVLREQDCQIASHGPTVLGDVVLLRPERSATPRLKPRSALPPSAPSRLVGGRVAR
jgi:hypothetical protein